MKIFKKNLLLAVVLCATITTGLPAQNIKDRVIIENYYKVKWGYADEFIDLWKKNHYPLLQKAKEKGDIISVEAYTPAFHDGEDTRWDFKVILTFKDLKTTFDPNLTTPYRKQLYPDSAALQKAEQHRFSLLISHWDVIINPVEL